MAIIECKECSKEISSKAEQCPYCGVSYKKKKSSGLLEIFIGPFIIALGTIMNGFFSGIILSIGIFILFYGLVMNHKSHTRK